jgi:hypothetical protein
MNNSPEEEKCFWHITKEYSNNMSSTFIGACRVMGMEPTSSLKSNDDPAEKVPLLPPLPYKQAKTLTERHQSHSQGQACTRMPTSMEHWWPSKFIYPIGSIKRWGLWEESLESLTLMNETHGLTEEAQESFRPLHPSENAWKVLSMRNWPSTDTKSADAWMWSSRPQDL